MMPRNPRHRLSRYCEIGAICLHCRRGYETAISLKNCITCGSQVRRLAKAMPVAVFDTLDVLEKGALKLAESSFLQQWRAKKDKMERPTS